MCAPVRSQPRQHLLAGRNGSGTSVYCPIPADCPQPVTDRLLLATLVFFLAAAILAAYGMQLLALAAVGLRRPSTNSSAPAAAVWPRVTVQLPVYDEPDVVGRLIDAACTLDYPRESLEVQVLDDSPEGPAVSRAGSRVAHWRARGIDIKHIRRDDRRGYKAGALGHGLSPAAGDLLCVFDADFVPEPGFLRRSVPVLAADPAVGMVQARWTHLNEESSLLTRVQAALLDVHFAIEQEGRERAGLPLAFNGTAGVWRRACIEDAGGWQSDTLTEDLDLSYRAQLAGWRMRYLADLAAPGELPPTATALSGQQARWARGTAETARKLGRRVLRSRLPLRHRASAAMHLGSWLVHPSLVLVALLHPAARLLGPVSDAAWGVAGVVGGIALVGVMLAHVVAARRAGASVSRRLLLLPAVLALPVGLAPGNTYAIIRSLAGERAEFHRTPKAASAFAAVGGLRWAEAAFGLLTLGGAAALAGAGLVGAAAFQVLFAAGGLWLAVHDAAIPGGGSRRPVPAVA